MITVSPSTQLFGEAPLNGPSFKMTPQEAAVRDEIAREWELVPIVRKKEEPPMVETKGEVKPQERTELVANSLGQKIFAMFSNFKPSADSRKPDSVKPPEAKAVDAKPTRKMKTR